MDYGFWSIFAQDLEMLEGHRDFWQAAPLSSPVWSTDTLKYPESLRHAGAAEFAAGTERVKAALQCDFYLFFFFKSHFLHVQRQFIFWAFFGTQGGAFSLRHFL